MEDNYREVKKAEPCLKLIHMDQVEVEEIEWLFYDDYIWLADSRSNFVYVYVF